MAVNPNHVRTGVVSGIPAKMVAWKKDSKVVLDWTWRLLKLTGDLRQLATGTVLLRPLGGA